LAQTEADCTALPIREPEIPHIAIVDVRNATAPQGFQDNRLWIRSFLPFFKPSGVD
jgi:hypothetical protein